MCRSASLHRYLVLPQVAHKQFQSLDCVPYPHNNGSFLRSDTAVDCKSAPYRQFRAAVAVFIVIYQSVPALWFYLLWRVKPLLNPPTSGSDKKLALFIRDQNKDLASIRFLFKDYNADKARTGQGRETKLEARSLFAFASPISFLFQHPIPARLFLPLLTPLPLSLLKTNAHT
jgi:hypothetical protein